MRHDIRAIDAPAIDLAIRPGRDADAEHLIALMGAVWGEYAGIVFDVDGELPELRALASHFARADGLLWVAEREADGVILGMIGMKPARESGSDGIELHKLYVAREARRFGLASRLLRLVESEARARDSGFVTLWTDSRFVEAHAFYERHGYVRQPGERALGDLSNSIEYRYRKTLA